MDQNKTTIDWRIFTGGKDAAVNDKPFPQAPPWRVPGAARERVLASTFRPTQALTDAVNAAIYLRRPLLVTGKPGSGKSSLIHAVARELNLGKVLSWPINSRSALRDSLYTYDALARLQFIQERQALRQHGETDPEAEDIGAFITLGPLGTALASTGRPRALLVDEIDKSDVDLPNDLLNVLDTGHFSIDELRRHGGEPVKVTDSEGNPVIVNGGGIAFTEFPFVVMTSNGERDFPAPFLRRCVQFELPEPNEDELRRIIMAHFRELPEDDKDLSKSDPDSLLKKFLDKRREQPMSTDQLLNAVHVKRNSGLALTEPETDALLATLFRKLG
jgi:MoxR-like ATPase